MVITAIAMTVEMSWNVVKDISPDNEDQDHHEDLI
jgi:hypothetical protein